MKSLLPEAFAQSLLLALLAIVPAVVFSEDPCTDCESTRWGASVFDFSVEGEYGLHGEDAICLVAKIKAILDALTFGGDVCVEHADGEPCASKSESCPPGSHCELGYSLDVLFASPLPAEPPLEPLPKCMAEQLIDCFCHCVKDPVPTPKPYPSTSPTPSKTATPQPSRVT